MFPMQDQSGANSSLLTIIPADPVVIKVNWIESDRHVSRSHRVTVWENINIVITKEYIAMSNMKRL